MFNRSPTDSHRSSKFLHCYSGVYLGHRERCIEVVLHVPPVPTRLSASCNWKQKQDSDSVEGINSTFLQSVHWITLLNAEFSNAVLLY